MNCQNCGQPIDSSYAWHPAKQKYCFKCALQMRFKGDKLTHLRVTTIHNHWSGK